MNASYSVFYILMSVLCVLLGHNCLSITNCYTASFTSRTTGWTSGL